MKKGKGTFSPTPLQALIAFLVVSFLVAAVASFAVNKAFLSSLEKDILNENNVPAPAPAEFTAPVSQISEEPDIDREPLVSSLVLIYRKKESDSILDRLYLPKDLRGAGFVLTSDGWLVTSADVFDKTDENLLVVERGQVVYGIEKKVVDFASGAAFVKINASNLPVSKLGNSGELRSGDTVFAASRDKKLVLNFVENPDYAALNNKRDFIFSSEKFNNFISLQNVLPTAVVGGPVFNKNGEVVGLQKEAKEGVVLAAPIDNFSGIFSGVLKNEKVSRTYLGVNYLDISYLAGFQREEGLYKIGGLSLKSLKGAYIFNEIRSRAAKAGSPARAAGLRYGDLIIKVNGLEIDSKNKLNAVIQEYKPGDTVQVVVRRNGQELSMSVELGELKAK